MITSNGILGITNTKIYHFFKTSTKLKWPQYEIETLAEFLPPLSSNPDSILAQNGIVREELGRLSGEINVKS